MTLPTALESPETGHPPATIGAGSSIAIDTRFGVVSFSDENRITMPRGLLGYAGYHDFALAPLPGDGMEQFMILQSLEDHGLSFVVAPYNTENGSIESADIAQACAVIGIAPENAAVFLVVSTRQIGQMVQISVNLRAPVIADRVNATAYQHVLLNNRYSVREVIATAQKQPG